MSLSDISDLIAQLGARGAKKVALQFPEGLKRQAAATAAALTSAGFEVIVSGDPLLRCLRSCPG